MSNFDINLHFFNPQRELVIENWPGVLVKEKARYKVELYGRNCYDRISFALFNPLSRTWRKPILRKPARKALIAEGSDGQFYTIEYFEVYFTITQCSPSQLSKTVKSTDSQFTRLKLLMLI